VEFLNWFNTSMKNYKEDIYMVGEAWTNGTSIEEYYESGIDSFFNFPYSQTQGKIISAVRSRNGAKFAEDLEQWQEQIKVSNEDAIDAVFLSNHDNGRSAGYLGRKLENEKMAASLYLMMPGNSFIYYGEEIGMIGSGIDENKRMPFLWSTKSKTGMTFSPPNATQSENIDAGVLEQEQDEASLLQFYKKAIMLKNQNPEIARGSIKLIEVGDEKLCAYSSEYEGSKVYIIHNLSDKYLNKTVVLGIRPEDIFLSESSATSNIQVKVDIAELMGSETYLYIHCNGNNLTAKVPSTSTLKTDDIITINFDSEKLHFFDKETEKAICN